jgi:hypothetical protein
MSNGGNMLTHKGRKCVFKVENEYLNPPVYIYEGNNAIVNVILPGKFLIMDGFCSYPFKISIDDWYYMWEGSKKKHKFCNIFK